MTRRLSIAALLLGLATTPALADPPLPVWRDGTVQPKSDAGFIYMAAEGGFAAQQGIDLHMLSLRGDGLLLKALVAGELDSYEGTPGGPMIAASHGADIRIVGCNWPGLTYAIYTRPDITAVQQLRGKTIGVSSPGALPDLFTRAVLDKAGIKPDAVHLAIIGSDADRVNALVAKVIDAAPSSTEFSVDAGKRGLHMLVRAHDATPNFIRLCIMMRGATLREKPALAAHFLAAEMRAYRHSLADPAAEIALSRKIAHLPPDYQGPEEMFREVSEDHAVSPDLGIDVKKLDWLKDLLVQTGSVPASFNPASIVDDAPRQAALALLAKAPPALVPAPAPGH